MATSTPIFNSNQVYAGAFHVGNTKVQFGSNSTDHLTQSIQFQYAQQVQMIYELGSVQRADGVATEQNVYYAGGRASGTANLARVLTGRPATNDALLQAYNNICNPQSITVTVLPKACLADRNSSTGAIVQGSDGQPSMTTLSNTQADTVLGSAILQSLSGSIDTQSAMFTQQMSFMFLNMTQS